MSPPQTRTKISCIILAGGEGKRVGGVDKGLIEYNDKPLIKHVIDAVKPQIDELVISANRNIEYYKKYTDKVISDESEHYLGPLAGINAALPYCEYDQVLVVPCDTPFLPDNVVDQFLSGPPDRNIYIAESLGKLQPVMLINRSLQKSISQSLDKNELRLMFWVKAHQPEIIEFPDDTAFRSFNNTEDFER